MASPSLGCSIQSGGSIVTGCAYARPRRAKRWCRADWRRRCPQVGSAPTKGPGARVVRIGGSVAGSGAGAGVVVSPMVPKNSQLERVGDGRPQESWGAISDIGWQNTQYGWTSVPSNDAKQRMEDDIFQESAWQLRNKVLPDLMLVPQPFPDAWGSPDNYNWNWLTNTWTPKAGTVVPGGGF